MLVVHSIVLSIAAAPYPQTGSASHAEKVLQLADEQQIGCIERPPTRGPATHHGTGGKPPQHHATERSAGGLRCERKKVHEAPVREVRAVEVRG